MSEKLYAKATHQFSAPAEAVYDAWLDPEKVRIWMAAALAECGLAGDMQRIEIDPQVGGQFFFSDMRDGQEARHWGTYLELDRPRKIVFTWIVDESQEEDPSKVTITIQPKGAGCTATIMHEMDAEWAEYVSRTEEGWARMFKAIDRLTAAG